MKMQCTRGRQIFSELRTQMCAATLSNNFWSIAYNIITCNFIKDTQAATSNIIYGIFPATALTKFSGEAALNALIRRKSGCPISFEVGIESCIC